MGVKQTTKHYDRVLEFMKIVKSRGGKDQIPNTPRIPSDDIRRLRARLILEEAIETVEALGFDFREVLSCDEPDFQTGKECIKLFDEYPPSLVEIADGCADISVVTIGTLIACGIKDRPLLEEVDRNNLAKFGGKPIIREDGKLVKPEGWKGPDIKRVLEEQGK